MSVFELDIDNKDAHNTIYTQSTARYAQRRFAYI